MKSIRLHRIIFILSTAHSPQDAAIDMVIEFGPSVQCPYADPVKAAQWHDGLKSIQGQHYIEVIDEEKA